MNAPKTASRRQFLKAAACAPAAFALSCARTSLKEDEHANAAPVVVDGHLHCFAGPGDPRFP